MKKTLISTLALAALGGLFAYDNHVYQRLPDARFAVARVDPTHVRERTDGLQMRDYRDTDRDGSLDTLSTTQCFTYSPAGGACVQLDSVKIADRPDLFTKANGAYAVYWKKN
jgi:hypothetical protein